MATDRINLEDFLDPRIRKELETLNKELKQTMANMGKLTKETQKLNKSFNPKNINQVTKSRKRLNQVQEESQKTQKKAITTAQKYEQKLNSITKEEIRYKQQLKDKRQQLKQEIRTEGVAADSLEKKRVELIRLNQKYDESSAKIRRKMLPQIKKLRKEIGKAEEATGRHQRSVGQYGKALGNLKMKVVGAAMAIVAMVRGISRGIKMFSRFEKQIDKVAAISGATDDQIKALTESAITLGSTTTKTATQVGELQEEFARLGFTTEQILAATEATIRLSEVADADLGEAAKVAASTLNGFGLEATETNRVVDVMAKSFTSSALDLTKFTNSMNKVAPVAKNMGFSIEETTAMIGKLTDAGVRAETAGAQLRNIFLTLAKEGMTLEEAYSKINNATNKNATSLEMFGKRAAPIAQILAENADETERFAEELNNATGTAEDMSEQITDNLEGDVKRLTSAWEGFVLSIENGTGTISRSFRTIIQGMTNLVQKFTDTNKASEILQEVLGLDYWKDGLLRPGIYKDLGNLAAQLDKIRVKMGAASSGEIIRQISKWKGRIRAVGDETFAARKKQELYNYYIEQLNELLKENRKNWEASKDAGEEEEEEEERINREIVEMRKRRSLAIQGIMQDRVNAEKLYMKDLAYEEEEQLTAREQHYRNLQEEMKEMDRDYLKHFAKMKGKEGEMAKEELEKRKLNREEWTNFGVQQAKKLSDSIFQYRAQEVEVERQMAVEKAKARGASEEEIREIEKKYAKQRQQDAISKAIINAALGITSAFAPYIPGVSELMAGIIAATTGVQITTIKAQKFAKGTKDSGSDQLAWVGEKGTEAVREKDGKTWFTPDKPTLMPLKAHSEVIPNKQLQNDLALMGGGRQEGNQEEERRHRELMKAIKGSKDATYMNVTEKGFGITARKGNTWINYIDRKYRK